MSFSCSSKIAILCLLIGSVGCGKGNKSAGVNENGTCNSAFIEAYNGIGITADSIQTKYFTDEGKMNDNAIAHQDTLLTDYDGLNAQCKSLFATYPGTTCKSVKKTTGQLYQAHTEDLRGNCDLIAANNSKLHSTSSTSIATPSTSAQTPSDLLDPSDF